MLSEKPWKFEAILRLLVGVFICVATGATILNATRFSSVGEVDERIIFALVASTLACSVCALFMLRRSWPIERFTRHFMGLLCCLYLVVMLGSLVQHFVGKADVGLSIWRMIAAAISFQGSALVLTHFFLREHGTRWADAFGFGNDRQRALLFGTLGGCFFFPIGWGMQWASVQVLSQVGINPVEQQAVQTLKITESSLARLTLAATAIVLAPVAEEVLFRGLLYPTIKQAGFPRMALWSTALLFAVVHQNLASFVPLFVLAVALSLLYEKTNNLLATIAAHSCFNTMNFTALCLFQSRFGQSPGP